MKIVEDIQLKTVIFTAVKNRCILHGRVFIMMGILVFLRHSSKLLVPYRRVL